jgi:putative membrane protein
MMTFLLLLVKGFVIGIAFIIPGVSGGTLAIYLGVYKKLIESIGNIFKDFKKSFKFLFPLFLGIGISVVALAKVFSILLNWNSFIVLFFFIGLIIGGVKQIYSETEKRSFKLVDVLAFAISFLGLLTIIILDKSSSSSGIGYFDFQFSTYLLLIVLGMVASITMIVPGISGSAVLLVLGFYTAIVSNVVGNIFDFDNIVYNLKVIIPFAIGAVIGIILFSKLLNILLEAYPKQTYAAILGFIIASVIGVFMEIKHHETAVLFEQQIPIYKDLLVFIGDEIWTVIAGLFAGIGGCLLTRYMTKTVREVEK